MVYDFGDLTENNDVVNYGSTRSLSSSDAEFDLEDRPALIRGRMRCMPSPQTQRSRLRSVSASRKASALTVDHPSNGKSDVTIPDDISVLLTDCDNGYPSTHDSKNTVRSAAEIRIQNECCTKDAASPTAIGVADSQDTKLSGSIHRWMKKKTSDKKSTWRNFDSPLRSTRNEETEDEQLGATESPPKSPRQSSLSPMKSTRRFWSNHMSEENTQSKVESADAPSSPSKQKSTQSSFVSPMKLRSQRVLSTILGGRSQVTDNKDEHSLNRSEHLGDESPIKKGSVSSSLGQRTFGTVLRGWQQSKDNKIDTPSPETNNTDSISVNLVQATLSPTRRAVSGILRVRSCHDRSTRTNKSNDVLVVDNGEPMHKSQSVHVRTTYHNKDAKNETNCVQLNIEELVRGETVTSSNSERGTRSSIPVPDNDIDETVHSRTVRSLVSPRQQKSRKLRVSSAHTEKDTKSHRRRSGSGSVVSSSRSTRSVGEKSRSSSRSRNRLQQQVSQSELRSKSMPRSRDSKIVGQSDGNLRSRSRSQGRPASIDDDNKTYENSKRPREAIRSGQSDNTPKTPKSNQLKDNGEVRSITELSRMQDEMKSPRSRREMDRSMKNSKRILSDAHSAALDRPKTPRSAKSRSNGQGEGAKKIRENLRDLQSPGLDDTKTSISSSNSKSEHSTQKRSISRQRRVSRGLSGNGTSIGEPNRSVIPSQVTSIVPGNGGIDVGNSDACSLNRSSSTRRSSISSRSSRNDPKSPGSTMVARSSHSFSQRTPSRRRTSLSDRAQSARDLKRKIKSELDNDTHKATSQSDSGRNTNTKAKSTESLPNVDKSKRMINERNRVHGKPSASGSNRVTNDERQSVYVCD